MDEFVSVNVRAELTDVGLAKQDAEDLAWDHAKLASLARGIAVGDDEFIKIYNELLKVYERLADHLEFLMFNALVVLRSMLNSGLIVLNADTPIKDTDLALMLGQLAHKIVTSYAWMVAGFGITYPKNHEMPDAGVSFKFPTDDITFTQE